MPQRLTRPTWALGTLALSFFAIELLTGLGLTFFYRPAPETAWADIADLREASAFGFLRDLHFWGSHALIIAVWLHLLRTFASGLYKPPRHAGWTGGVALLVLTLSLAYTGSLLPWDGGARRSIATRVPDVSTPAGPPREVDGATLRRFYALHCGLLPAATIGLLVHHVWVARRRQPEQDPAEEA